MNLEKIMYLLNMGWESVLHHPKVQREFHTLRRLKPGHWHYMGHDIIRNDETQRWYTIPPSEESPFKTKDTVRWHLYHEYEKLCRAVVDIERESSENQNHLR